MTNTTTDPTTPRVSLELLNTARQRLIVSLTAAASSLESHGEPPAMGLLEELSEYQQQLHQLHTRLTGIPPRGRIAWEELHALGALSQHRSQWATVCTHALSVRHVDQPEFAGLTEVHVAAQSALDHFQQPVPQLPAADWREWEQGRHPLQVLVTLILDTERLNDAEWDAANEIVSATYGKALATAIVRGKIKAEGRVLQTSPVPTDAPVIFLKPREQPPAAHVTSPPALFADALPTVEYQPDWGLPAQANPAHLSHVALPPGLQQAWDAQHQTVQPKLPVSAARSQPLLPVESSLSDQASIFDEALPAQSASSLRGLGTSSAAPTNSQAASFIELAQNAQARPSAERGEVLSEIVLQLVQNDRLGLAYHLTKCHEDQQLPLPGMLPGWLLRALCLSRTVRYPHGEIARLLEHDFSRFEPGLLRQGDGADALARGLFLRAAAMLPALFTGSPGAIAMLRAFRIGPDCSQLYNYCSRLTLYGQRLQGQLAALGTAVSAEANHSVELTTLRERTRTWLHETLQQYLPFARTSPLYLHAHWTVLASTARQVPAAVADWCQWQDIVRNISRVLQPLLTADKPDRVLIKQELDRLSRLIQLDSTRPDRVGLPTHSPTLIQSPEMRTVITEAVDLASQWLRLTNSNNHSIPSIHARELAELRREIQQRTGPVLVELRALAHVYPTRELKAAVSCCLRVVEDIQTLFSMEEWQSPQEPDPRHVLHRDLLKLSASQLNEHWLPLASPAVTEQELLEFLSHAEPDWQQVYHWQSSLLDHVTTGRLLELDVWSTPAERAELRTQREQSIARCRQDLARDMDQARQELHVAQASALPAGEMQTLQQRLDRLAATLPQTLNFADLQRQLQLIRQSLQRYQQQATEREEQRLSPLKPRPTATAAVAVESMPGTPATTINRPLTPPASPTSAWVLDV